MTVDDVYTTLHRTPTVETYRRIRASSGLSAKTVEAATTGLAHTLFAVQILHDGETIGIGRVVGDGGCFFQVVDIAVLPQHRGRGLGKRIVADIVAWLHENAPSSAHVSLIADGEAHRLYAQFGFAPTAPAAIGMDLRLG